MEAMGEEAMAVEAVAEAVATEMEEAVYLEMEEEHPAEADCEQGKQRHKGQCCPAPSTAPTPGAESVGTGLVCTTVWCFVCVVCASTKSLNPMLQSAIKKKCPGCKGNKTLDQFGIKKIDNGKAIPYVKCGKCRARANAWKKTEKGKAANKKNKTSEKGKASQKRASKKHAQSEKGKASRKLARESEAGKERRRRFNATKRQRRKEDPAFAMMEAIRCAATHLASGERKKSPTFVQRTSFKSSVHFRNHLRSKLPNGVLFNDHGKKWEVEHKIPVQAYDFSDKKDIKRCWSEANVHTMCRQENMKKSITIIDALCEEVGKEFWPQSWKGRIPNEKEKQEFYAKCNQ